MAARDALEKFQRLGVSTKGARLAEYSQTLSRFSGMHSHEIAKVGGTALVSNSMVEAADLIEIAGLSDNYLRHRLILPRVKIALAGRSFRKHYAPREHDPHRDAAFELCTAAYLQRTNVLGPPPENRAEVIFRDGATSLPVECKRVSSKLRLKENLRNARNQLRDRIREGAVPGFIALDLTRAMNPTSTLFYFASAEAMVAGCGNKLYKFLAENINSVQHPDIECDFVLGVAIRLTIPGYCTTAANARRFIEWTFVPIRRDEVGAALFDLCIERFGVGPIRRLEHRRYFLPNVLGQNLGFSFFENQIRQTREALPILNLTHRFNDVVD